MYLLKVSEVNMPPAGRIRVKSYLSNRILKTDISNFLSDIETIKISVLQGTILGPLLFFCYIIDLPLATIPLKG
jgi:hypothetical protein